MPCASYTVHQKASASKKLNYFYVQTPSFCVFSSVKKQDMTSSNNGIMGKEDLPPSSGLS